jgi:hypothetical protein
MRIIYLLIVVLIISSCSDKREMLFNGKNLDGWTIYVEDESINPDEYFYVKDEMIETVGKPIGYARTNKEYENYKLHVEWRYPEKPTNSGVFVHVKGDDKIWISHYQGQLKYENAGDFIIHGVESATLDGKVYTSTEDDKPLISKMYPTNEKAAGEWNTYEIICKGNTIELHVNGLLQNVATNCSVTKGGIGLQAEGSKIQFRNLWVESID